MSKEGVKVDPRKVQSIREWATPTSCCEVRRFIGLAGYYRRFVEGFADVAAPLTALGSPTATFSWTPAAQESFDALKELLSTAPVLRTWDPSRRAVLTTDASGVAVSAILTQADDAGRQHPVAYESRKLTTTERNYPAHVLELLAVVHALRVFKHYLLGSGAPAGQRRYLLGSGAAGPTSTCARTTRPSRGSGPTGTSTGCTRAGSTNSPSTVSR